jgi:hypothetical protein
LTELLEYFIYERFALGSITGIAFPSFGLYAQALNFLLEGSGFLRAAVTYISECDVRPLFSQFKGDGFSDSPGCTGNNGNFAVKQFHKQWFEWP